MKLNGRSYQTTTQVKVLSPEISYTAEVDFFILKEDKTTIIVRGESIGALPGSKSVV
jgi:hypothetical protein